MQLFRKDLEGCRLRHGAQHGSTMHSLLSLAKFFQELGKTTELRQGRKSSAWPMNVEKRFAPEWYESTAEAQSP